VMLDSYTGSYVAVSGKEIITKEGITNLPPIVFQNKPMKCRLHLNVVNADKALMVQQSTTHRESRRSKANTIKDAPTEAVVIPPARNLDPDNDWVTITSGETKPMTSHDLEKARWKQGDGIWYI
jgi:hypothetical protein